MNLGDVYPIIGLKEKFEKEVVVEFFGPKEIDKIIKLEPQCLFEIGANAWMHYVESGAKVKPQQLAKYFDSHDPLIYQRVEKVMKRKVLQDIVLVHANVNDDLERRICGKLLLARTYPNNLHISDVEFSNPYKPVSASEQKYQYHDYRSLGLFSELLANIMQLGQEHKISKITLSAASKDQVIYFEKHGFSIEETEFAKHAVSAGRSIPMEKKCT